MADIVLWLTLLAAWFIYLSLTGREGITALITRTVTEVLIGTCLGFGFGQALVDILTK